MTTLGTIVSKAAPVLGSVLNTVLPGSSLVISSLMAIFGVHTQDDLENAIKSDADSALKLKQFELTHIEELEKIASQDRNSARNREVEIVKSTGKRDHLFTFVVITVMLGFISCCALVGMTKMDQTDHDIFYMLLGILGTKFGSVVDYFVGSGSQSRSETQRQSNNDFNLPPPAQTR